MFVTASSTISCVLSASSDFTPSSPILSVDDVFRRSMYSLILYSSLLNLLNMSSNCCAVAWPKNKPVFSFLRHCKHDTAHNYLLLIAVDRKADAPAADAPCSNRSISPACEAHSSKPAARCCSGRQMGQTNGWADSVPLHRPCRLLCQQCQQMQASRPLHRSTPWHRKVIIVYDYQWVVLSVDRSLGSRCKIGILPQKPEVVTVSQHHRIFN